MSALPLLCPLCLCYVHSRLHSAPELCSSHAHDSVTVCTRAVEKDLPQLTFCVRVPCASQQEKQKELKMERERSDSSMAKRGLAEERDRIKER